MNFQIFVMVHGFFGLNPNFLGEVSKYNEINRQLRKHDKIRIFLLKLKENLSLYNELGQSRAMMSDDFKS